MADHHELYVVNQHESLEAAMLLIEENRHRSVIVVDDGGVVVGTLSDGDVRKAILDRRLLTTPVEQVMNTNFAFVRPADRQQVQAYFEQEHLFLVPVVDNDGQLIEILTAY